MSSAQSGNEGIQLPVDLMAKIRSSLSNADNAKNTLFHSVKDSQERYIDRRHLAEGAMKVIYECRDVVAGRQVAMAFPKHIEEKEAVEQFFREARVLTTLDHPNIIPVYDIGLDDGKTPYFTMKLIHGESLEELLKKTSSDSMHELPSRLRIFERVCEALAFAHSKGVVHLDLKPDNIQLSQYGEVQVCDWGLAKLMNDCSETASVLLDDESLNFAETSLAMIKEGTRGTPGYMAPEQISESDTEHDRRTDIFSLGALLYSLITLKKPFEGSLDEILEKTKVGQVISPEKINPNCSSSLSAICMKALSVNPDQRYQKVDDLLKDLHAYMNGLQQMPKTQALLCSSSYFIDGIV